MFTKLSRNDKNMLNDQLVIRAMSPPGRDVAKWLARLMEIPVRTARFWAEQTVPVYRREEVYRRLLEKFYARRKWEDENLLPELLRGAGLVDDVEIVPASNIANAAADLVFAAQHRVEAAIDWLEE
jgi:hypothetical protein